MTIDIDKLSKLLNLSPAHKQPSSFHKVLEQEKIDQAIPAAVFVGLQWIENAWHVLLTKRSQHLKEHAGHISFPGGLVDAEDKNHQDTAIREAKEEIGLLPENVRILGNLQIHLIAQRFIVTPVVGIVYQHIPKIHSAEVDEFFTAPIDFFLAEENCLPDQRRPGYFGFQFDYDGKNIWGGTANILLNLKSILKKC